MSVNDDISLILTKAKRSGFFEDVKSEEVNFLTQEAKTLFTGDSVFDTSLSYEPLTVNGYRASRLRDNSIDIVKETGVVTNGVSLARDLINNFLNTLPTGRRIIFREGVYNIDNRISTIKAGTILEGEGPNTVLLISNSGLLDVFVNDITLKNMTVRSISGTLASVFREHTAVGSFKNWKIENVIFDKCAVRLSKFGVATDVGALTTANGLASNVEFENCEFTGYTDDGALWVRGSDYVTVSKCNFHDMGTDRNKGDALKYSYGAQYGKILHSNFWNLKRDAIDLYDSDGVLVDGCNMTDIDAHAIEAKFQTTSNTAKSHKFVNNTALRAQKTGGVADPTFQFATHQIIAANNISDGGTGYGFRVGGPFDNPAILAKGGMWIGNRSMNNGNHGFVSGGSELHGYIGNIAHNNLGKGFELTNDTSLAADNQATNISYSNGLADTWS